MTEVQFPTAGGGEQPTISPPLRSPDRVALVHYWMVNMRGGERVLEALGEMFRDDHMSIYVGVRNGCRAS